MGSVGLVGTLPARSEAVPAAKACGATETGAGYVGGPPPAGFRSAHFQSWLVEWTAPGAMRVPAVPHGGSSELGPDYYSVV